ncbi:hypothetical protein [Bradyrhizobium sp. USDA 10063]
MKQSIFVKLEPYEWTQSLRGEHARRYNGRNLGLSAHVMAAKHVVLVNSNEKLEHLTAHMSLHSGEPKMGDGKPFTEGIGMFVFNEARPGGIDYPGIDAAIMGWFYLDPELYEEAWAQVAANTYSSCTLSLTVKPVPFHGIEWHWDVKNNGKLIIDAADMYFSRSRTLKREPPEPPPKRGFFR